jgi:hypothetical protein
MPEPKFFSFAQEERLSNPAASAAYAGFQFA